MKDIRGEYVHGANDMLHAIVRYLNNQAIERDKKCAHYFEVENTEMAMRFQYESWALSDAAQYLLSPGMKI